MSDDGDDVDLEALREQTQQGSRVEQSASNDPDDDPLEDAIADSLAAIDAGEQRETISVRDERMAALMRALDETGELEAFGAALQDHLGRPDEAIDQSTVARLLMRVGLQAAAPDQMDALGDAVAQHARDSL